ncbi:MAG: hypothetical protein N3B16_04165 [Candidatus Aminicenantes bacterium]|nr:hypothetical protein [Candidatus Aminicenantes bacterium]
MERHHWLCHPSMSPFKIMGKAEPVFQLDETGLSRSWVGQHLACFLSFVRSTD